MKEKCFKIIAVVIIVCTFTSASLLHPQQSKFVKLFKVKIDNQVYQVGQISQMGLSGEVVLNEKGNFVTDKDILKKAFHVGDICGCGTKKDDNFSGFITKVDRDIQEYQAKLDIIPPAEVLGAYAFNIGPRALVESLKILLTGGSSFAAKVGLSKKELFKHFMKELGKTTWKVIKPALEEALKDLKKNPRPFIVTAIQSSFENAIYGLNETKKKAESLKNEDILDYEEIIDLELKHWAYVSLGEIAIAMYQELAGDLIGNLQDALNNAIDQLLSEVKDAQVVLDIEFIKDFIDGSIKITQVYETRDIRLNEMKALKDSNQKRLFSRLEPKIDLAYQIANQLSKYPTDLTTASTALSLIIDSSGSMSNNDPHLTRIFAGALVLDQGKSDWEIGIVEFDDSSNLIGKGNPQDQNLRDALKKIDASGRTNIQAGLKDGFDFLEKTTGWKKGAILLTDGDHNTPTRNFDYDKYVKIYTQKGWPVYTLGLTGGANAVLLSKIAAMTGGMYLKIASYQHMAIIIDIILSQFKDESLICQLKNNIKQGEKKEFPFLLDTSVNFMNMTGTYPGSKVDFSLIDPKNREISRTDTSRGVQVTVGKIYKIIKVKNPMPGQWKAKVKGLQVDRNTEPFEVKISADTPIKVETKEAKPVYIPFEPIKFKVNTAGNVNDKSLSYAVNVTPPEGKPENIPLRKSSQVVYPKTQKPGVYYFKVKVTGEKTDKEQFMREGLKHIVVSDAGKEYGVGQIIKLMGGYFEIDLGKEIGLKIGKKIFVFSIPGGVKRKIAEGFVTSVSQGKSMVQLTASWAIEPPKVGNRVEIDRKEF